MLSNYIYLLGDSSVSYDSVAIEKLMEFKTKILNISIEVLQDFRRYNNLNDDFILELNIRQDLEDVIEYDEMCTVVENLNSIGIANKYK